MPLTNTHLDSSGQTLCVPLYTTEQLLVRSISVAYVSVSVSAPAYAAMLLFMFIQMMINSTTAAFLISTLYDAAAHLS